MLATTLALVFLLLGRAQMQQQQNPQESTSDERIESLQKKVASLEKELNYWQNTTINILKKYLLENEGTGENHCTPSDDSYIKDKLEKLGQKIENIHNSTQGYEIHLENIDVKLASVETEFSANITNIEQKISQLTHPLLGSFLNPAPSCKLISQGSPSGHYWIQNAGTRYANLEYCDMTRRCCNSTGGWMRVAHLNMTDTNQQCPSGFRLITSPKMMCGTPGSRCVSTTFPLNGIKYSRICGKVIGYQYGSTNAFNRYQRNRSLTIDDIYVDGVSLTHGHRPRTHIWTFVAACSRNGGSSCPCTTSYTLAVPPFIGQDYFCDIGNGHNQVQSQWYHADPLWDGPVCDSTSNCCGFNNQPWFCKHLPQPTTDDIEIRVCVNQATNNEDVALESVEIYVQ